MRNASHTALVTVAGLLLLASVCVGLECDAHAQAPSPQPKTVPPYQQTSPPVAKPPAPDQAAVQPDTGSISGSVYTNPYFGFSIAFPKGWKVVQSGRAKAQLGRNEVRLRKDDPAPRRRAPKPRTSSIPLLTVTANTPERTGLLQERFGILADDFSNQKGQVSAELVVRSMQWTARLANPPIKYLGNPQKVTVGDKKLWKTSWTETVNGVALYAVQYLTVEKKYSVQFNLVSPNQSELADLEPVIQTLKFFPPTN